MIESDALLKVCCVGDLLFDPLLTLGLIESGVDETDPPLGVPRRSLQTKRTPWKRESWNLAMAAVHAASVR